MKKLHVSFRIILDTVFPVLLFGLVLFSSSIQAQSDTLTSTEKSKFERFIRNFDASVYIDAYYTFVLDDPAGDTSNLMEFAANSPFSDEFRLNVASIWLEYNSKNIRGKFLAQFGDIPNLRTSDSEQFIKYMKEAHFGFRAYKTMWVDIGYLPNPIGYESSFPINNQISTVTVGGYFETGNFLGVKVSGQLTPSLFAGIYVGNQYTLAYGKNKRIYGGMTLLYNYKDMFSVNYNNMIGNASIVTSETSHFYLYNNLILTVTPVKNLLLVGQADFGFYGNSPKPPDTTNLASGMSGFLQATYRFTKWFAVSVRGEYMNDPDGAVTQLYAYDGKLRGLLTYGGTVGVEFNPEKHSYIRAEYSYLSADKGNYVFNSMLTDNRNSLTFTAGLRFGIF
ncbi:MAG: outer membrane beta-barrel protein [Bacteroidales bacterium]|nr:outer membrane beta-barrel protein [Bacteroidales bacterium]